MIEPQGLKNRVLDQDAVLLFVYCEIRQNEGDESSLLSKALRTLSELRYRLLYLEVSEFYLPLQVTVGLSLSPSTTEKTAIEAMQQIERSLRKSCRPCEITEMRGVLAPSLPELRELVSKPQN